MGSNVNPFSPLNFSFCRLLMVINSVFIVSGAADFSLYSVLSKSGKATSSLSKLKTVIHERHRVEGQKLILIKTKPASIKIVKQIKLPSIFVVVFLSCVFEYELKLLKLVRKTHFDYLNFPSTWRDIYFTPFVNYSIERQTRCRLFVFPLLFT